ncbi:MAG: thiamine pyrophosphate-dependent enzyme [Anaerolineae bacterium]|nr:thiamine pyrophosphate-dependent enzyme [Anaerolineae bacterium]
MLSTVDPKLGFMVEVIDDEKLARLDLSRKEIIEDYRLGYISRQASLLGRREVLNGRAKFGIFGDGKEVVQLAMARSFQKGDFRSGYYRDQTFMLAIGEITVQQLFAQLYAHADVEVEPMSGGRQMNSHFATRLINPDGSWVCQTDRHNVAADMSPTASQMPRLVGLGHASRLYREVEELKAFSQFSNNGNEVAFGTIGDASCAEGMFWEAVNAIGVLGGPVVISIWDDGYGISVPTELQITGGNLSKVLRGFQREADNRPGFDLVTVPGWDYLRLVEAYRVVVDKARHQHVPGLIHAVELTQPQGHSTSGSHERYKSEARLAWEADHDCLTRMRAWLINMGLATDEELTALETEATEIVYQARDAAWNALKADFQADVSEVVQLLGDVADQSPRDGQAVARIKENLEQLRRPTRLEIVRAVWNSLIAVRGEKSAAKQALIAWWGDKKSAFQDLYSTHLYSEGQDSALAVPVVEPVYSEQSPTVRGFEVMNAAFDAMLARDPRVVGFGEDVGHLGGVNQGWAGLQDKYGRLRVADTGIREATIIGQAIGLALRGLRPIAEIQYLDYILYAIPTLADDLASLRWRSAGGQTAPVIVRTRGHRLEGVWHSGSPMAGLINLLRGMHVLVPRDMVRAAGFYNTLLQAGEPGLIVEVLSGYRLKERLPDNLAEITTPIGVPEVLREGDDVTIVTYGACCPIALQAAEVLAEVDIDAEVIDVQSLLPFDVNYTIVESLKKTSRIVFLDEDVPGGASAYMMQQVLETQGGYHWLDSAPVTITAQAHRPAYGSDGGYFSKPTADNIFEAVYELMNEAEPVSYPVFYR